MEDTLLVKDLIGGILLIYSLIDTLSVEVVDSDVGLVPWNLTIFLVITPGYFLICTDVWLFLFSYYCRFRTGPKPGNRSIIIASIFLIPFPLICPSPPHTQFIKFWFWCCFFFYYEIFQNFYELFFSGEDIRTKLFKREFFSISI